MAVDPLGHRPREGPAWRGRLVERLAQHRTLLWSADGTSAANNRLPSFAECTKQTLALTTRKTVNKRISAASKLSV